MKKRAFIFPLLCILLLIFILSGCGVNPFSRNNQTFEERLEKLEERLNSLQKKALQREVVLYFLKETDTDFSLAPERRDVQLNGNELARIALVELIKGPKKGSDLEPVLNEEIRVLDLTIIEGLAWVDFSQELLSLNVGARLEEIIVYSIVNTLTDFPGIRAVRILVGGEEVETLAGHIYLLEPLFFNDAILYIPNRSL